jgi:hypothetical protein
MIMANKIEFTDLKAKDFVTNVSRYANSKVLYYSDEKITTFETYKRNKFKPSPRDQVAVVTPGLEYRPDLMSFDKYGMPDFWWKIMEANNMKDVSEFKAGRTVILPENVYG